MAYGFREENGMKDEKIFRLAKPVRGGILRLVFSRFLIIVKYFLLEA